MQTRAAYRHSTFTSQMRHPALLGQSLRPAPRPLSAPTMVLRKFHKLPAGCQVAPRSTCQQVLAPKIVSTVLAKRGTAVGCCRITYLPDTWPQVQHDWLFACTIRWSRNTPPLRPKSGASLLTQSTADPFRWAQCRPHAYPTAKLVVCLVG